MNTGDVGEEELGSNIRSPNRELVVSWTQRLPFDIVRIEAVESKLEELMVGNNTPPSQSSRNQNWNVSHWPMQ